MIIKMITIDFDDNKHSCSDCVYYDCSYKCDTIKTCSEFDKGYYPKVDYPKVEVKNETIF